MALTRTSQSLLRLFDTFHSRKRARGDVSGQRVPPTIAVSLNPPTTPISTKSKVCVVYGSCSGACCTLKNFNSLLNRLPRTAVASVGGAAIAPRAIRGLFSQWLFFTQESLGARPELNSLYTQVTARYHISCSS